MSSNSKVSSFSFFFSGLGEHRNIRLILKDPRMHRQCVTQMAASIPYGECMAAAALENFFILKMAIFILQEQRFLHLHRMTPIQTH